MPALGDPPPPSERQDRTVHGAPAPVAYIPRPLRTKSTSNTLAAGASRPDGRRAEETRACQIRAGIVPNAAGSAFIEQGRTKIIATVYGPRQAGERSQKEVEGLLFVETHFAPFCSRAKSKEENERRGLLYNSVLHRTLESVVLLERYGKTAFDVNLLVLEDDGAVLTAGLAVASLALADAGVEMRDLAAGATVHLTGDSLLLDCDGEEERALSDGSAVLHLGFCPSRDVMCLLHSVGPLPMEQFERVVLLAKEASQAVGVEMRRCLERQVERQTAKRQRLADAATSASDEATSKGQLEPLGTA